jgi:integrase
MGMAKLSDAFVKSAKIGKHEDGQGLRLIVSATSKRWVLRYQFAGKRREMGLGVYPDIKLSDARRMASQARAKVANGNDPIDDRTAARKARAPIPTFGQIAELVVEAEEAKNRRPRYMSALRRHVGPASVGNWTDRPVNSITSVDVLTLLAPIRKTRPEACRKIYAAVKKVFSHARVRLRAKHGIEFANPAHWEDLTAMGFEAPPKNTRGPYPSIHYSKMPELMEALRGDDAVASRMIEMTILTNVRGDSVRRARVEDFDIEKRIWTIPADKLKDSKTRDGKAHRVPLTDRAIEIVREYMPKSGKGLLFPNDDGKPFSYAKMLDRLDRLNGDNPRWVDATTERKITVHGFRATFSVWCEETQSFPTNVLREALGRVVGSPVDRVYLRSDLLEQRRPLMDNWHNHCFPSEGSVIAFPKGKKA